MFGTINDWLLPVVGRIPPLSQRERDAVTRSTEEKGWLRSDHYAERVMRKFVREFPEEGGRQ